MTSSLPADEAPYYSIPRHPLVGIEHPFVVKNVDKATNMLGGQKLLSERLHSGKNLALTIDATQPRPRSIMSAQTPTGNVLLKVSTPKRIGKRKRGSNEAFTPIEQPHPIMRDAQYLLRSMNDNEASTTIEASGSVEKSHVWRNLPDFDYATDGASFLANVQSKLMPQNYTKMKEWQLPRTFAATDTEIAPPPTFTPLTLPQTYTYHQPMTGSAPAVDRPRHISDQRQIVIRCKNLDPFPSAPSGRAPPLKTQPASLRSLIPDLQAIFTKRPIWTRRALINQLPDLRISDECAYALGYVAFFITKGPWSHTYCALGVDPRTDPKCRFYQTMGIARDKEEEQARAHRGDKPANFEDGRTQEMRARSHIFSGRGPLIDDGGMFQLCDLEDPQLKSLVEVDESHLSSECDRRDFGWYGNGTLTKIRIILRLKLNGSRYDNPLPDETFKAMLGYQERVSPYTPQTDSAPVSETATSLERALARAYREGCRNQGRSKVKLIGHALEDQVDSGDEDEDYEPDGTAMSSPL
jgi:general transcription factor 3C polypeptide 5 (transcription factor C subunit 1)